MDETIDATDRISELPDFIIHQIMSYLSPKEVARTSILSKRWKSSVISFPILDFDQRYFVRTSVIHRNSFARRENKRFCNDLRAFMKFVDASLGRFCQLEFCMQKFRLHITLLEVKESSPRIEGWIKLAIEKKVKELDLYFITEINTVMYSLPQIIFSAESMTTLKLVGCRLEQPFDAIKFFSLKKLTLERVYINEEMIQRLTSECSLLEDLFFSHCLGFKHFSVTKALKLKILEVHVSDMENFEIASPSLKQLTLCCTWNGSPQVINITECPHLEKLEFRTVNLTDQKFNHFISKFCLLEDLCVDSCNFLERIEISSTQLKNLKISHCDNLKVLDVDTPELLSFTYDHNPIPTSSINAQCPWNVLFEYKGDLDTRFLSLKEFLGQPSQSKHLRIVVMSNKISFDLDQFRESFSSPPSPVGDLALYIDIPSSDYEALLNALLWICYPNTLSVSMIEKNFGHWLYEELRNRNENCCNSCHIKCWRHHFNDYKMSFLEDSTSSENLLDINLTDGLPSLPCGTLQFHIC